MTKLFDTALKELFEVYPRDFISLLGIETSDPFRYLPTNLTSNIDTDLVLGLGDPLQAVIDVNFQSTWDSETPFRMFCYNALLHREHRLPVHSVAILLRSRENDLRLDTGLSYSVFPGRGRVDFQPEIIRIWERQSEDLLTGGVGLLPVASLAAVPAGMTREQAMPEIVRRVQERLAAECTTESTDRLLNWTYNLLGLHFTADEVKGILRRATSMLSDVLKDSMTFQATLEEGRVDGLQKALLDLGTDKFGPPSEAERAGLTATNDYHHLRRMTRAVLRVNSWNELFATK